MIDEMHKSRQTIRAKRIFDIVLSSFLLTVVSPFILLILLSIFIEHSLRLRPFDPLFYSEIRYSHGTPFSLYKFNIFKQQIIDSLRKTNGFIETKELERNGSILIVGHLLKQIYMDELPQLLNVFLGDMSIVGPRPVNGRTREYLISQGHSDKDRMCAGMTGLYQASHKTERGGPPQEILDKAYADFCDSHSWYRVLIFDLKIILKTVKVVLLARGI